MAVTIDGTNGVNSSGSFYGQSTYTGSYTDGVVVDYTTGTGRITVGTSDGFKIRNGGPSSPVDLVTIDSSGNVGIGTSSPSSYGQFAVVGNSTGNLYQATFANLNTGSNTTKQVSACWFLSDTVGTSKRVASVLAYPDNANVLAGGMTFNVRKTDSDVSEAMRIDSSGNLLVGTTSANFTFSTLSGNGVGIASNYSASYGQIINSTNATGTQFFIGFGRNGSGCGNISSTGTNSTTYATTSDYRLKENIVPMTDALATVAQLKPCTYTWKEDGSATQGFIAHELQSVVPEAVVGEKDAVDAEGNPIYQGIDTSFLVATLTAAIQELKAELDATKADVAVLKGQA